MERDEFFHQTKNMLTNIDEMLVSYSMGDQLTAHEATELWMQLNRLTSKFGKVKNKAQARDWGDEDKAQARDWKTAMDFRYKNEGDE